MPIITNDRLFDCGELSEFLEQRQRRLDVAIKSEDEDEILHNSDAVVARLLKVYSLVPCVCKDKTPMKKKGSQRGGKLTVSFRVTFTGSKELFEYRPNSFTGGFVYGNIRDDQIVVDIENDADGHEPLQREFDRWYANMEKWLKGANEQVKTFNKRLQSRIKGAIETSAQNIRADADVMSALKDDMRCVESDGDAGASKVS